MTRTSLDSVLHYTRSLLGETTECSEVELLDRFLGQHDEGAFAALVERHGGMVLGVCRRLLGNVADAEDAFQATFLVLARQAASLRLRPSLASWLYGIACRVAWRARADAARRRLHEHQARALRPVAGEAEPSGELGEILGEELARLPEKYRAPVVLCYLEGRTNEEAARQLGWPVGSVKGRLARARDLLRGRLARRGFAPSIAVLSAVLEAQAAGTVAPVLAQATIRAARATALGTAADSVSASVCALAEGALRPAVSARVKLTLAVLLVLAAVGAAGALAQPVPAPQPQGAAAPAQPAAARGKGEPVDLHGDPLPPHARARLGTTRFRQGAQVLSIAYSPDGKTLASVGHEQAIYLWDADSGRCLQRLPGHSRFCRAVAFSPDGSRLASCGEDLVVRVWDTATGRQLHALHGHRGEPTSVAFSPDGTCLASGAWNGTIRLWDVPTGKALGTLANLPRTVCRLAFAPGGKLLAAASHDGLAHVLDLATGKHVHRLAPGGDGVISVAFSRDGQLLATGSLSGNVVLWDASSGRRLRNWAELTGYATALAFTADGIVLATGHYVSGTTPPAPPHVRLWNTTTGREVRRLESCAGTITALALSPDGRTLTAGAGAALRRWDLRTGRALSPFGGHHDGVYSVAVSADGRAVFSAGGDGLLRRWDADTGKEVGTVARARGGIVCVRLAADGKTLAWAGTEPGAHLGTLDGARPWRNLGGGRSGLRALAFAPDSRTVATAADDVGLRIWSDTGKVPRSLAPGETVYCLAFAPDGKTLATGGYDGKEGVNDFKRWDVATGRELSRVTSMAKYTAIAFSPDGRWLAATLEGAAEPVQVRDLRTRELRSFSGHEGGASDVAFTPGGWMLASAGADGTVRLWETASGQERRRLQGHRGRVHCLAFSANGRRLVSGGSDTSLVVWDVATPGASAPAKGPPGPAELEALWVRLRDRDASRAYDAMCRLLAFPEQGVPLLRARLQGVKAARGKVEQWIRELDDRPFVVREKAREELARLGPEIEPELRRALAGAPLEARRRLEGLLAQLSGGPGKGPPPDSLRTLRTLEVLEQSGTAEARAALATLARVPAETLLGREARALLGRLKKRSPVAP
jgi:RNA polymerase sigma factor (sigma-70 family)